MSNNLCPQNQFLDQWVCGHSPCPLEGLDQVGVALAEMICKLDVLFGLWHTNRKMVTTVKMLEAVQSLGECQYIDACSPGQGVGEHSNR